MGRVIRVMGDFARPMHFGNARIGHLCINEPIVEEIC
jgi:hypothetical protein